MKWISWGNYAKQWKSFSICKVFIKNRVIYELWDFNQKQLLGRYESFNHAKDAALDIDRKQSQSSSRDEIKEIGLQQAMGSDNSREER